jgi:hypothetical protein
MADYLPCAGSPVSVASSADRTGLNSGNLTAAFTTGVLGTMPPVWEWYRASIAAQQRTQTFPPAPCSVYINLSKPVSFTYPVGGTEWDPSQPVQLRSGDELYFFWQLASSTTPVPVVTLFFRYDAALAANKPYGGIY